MLLLMSLLAGVSICSEALSAQDPVESIWPTKEWQTSYPEEQGMDSKKLGNLIDFGAARLLTSPGVAQSSRLDSLLVVRHGKIVVEAYYLADQIRDVSTEKPTEVGATPKHLIR